MIPQWLKKEAEHCGLIPRCPKCGLGEGDIMRYSNRRFASSGPCFGFAAQKGLLRCLRTETTFGLSVYRLDRPLRPGTFDHLAMPCLCNITKHVWPTCTVEKIGATRTQQELFEV